VRGLRLANFLRPRHTGDMKSPAWLIVVGLLASFTARADLQLPYLKTPGHTWSNVTVFSVTATDINFKHAQGIANAKLQDLEPELQKRFNYTPTGPGKEAMTPMPAETKSGARPTPATPPTDVEIRVPEIHAKSVMGKAAPPLQVEKWLTVPPNTTGKFVLVDLWATWCGPCRQSIPHLNQLAAKFGDQLVVVGLSDETEAQVNAMKSPKMNYAVGIDPQARFKKTLEVRGIPHALILDPKGIVRFEGHPGYLTEGGVATLLRKYAK
jgi:thiol-disulfide isomerase/thioredoxin